MVRRAILDAVPAATTDALMRRVTSSGVRARYVSILAELYALARDGEVRVHRGRNGSRRIEPVTEAS